MPDMSVSAPAAITSARWKPRLAAVVSAVAAALAVWVLAELVLGVDLRSPAVGSRAGAPIEPGWIALVSAVVSLAGWALLVILEKLISRARTVWTITAAVVFALSLAAPWQGTGISAGNRLLLTLMHVVIAAVLIPVLALTCDERRGT